jgi:sulfur relay (sulfurtransferase) DsrF/TusC family protein
MVIFSRGEDSHRVEEGLRLVAAMLGMDQPTTVVFVDDGRGILREDALTDELMRDYLTTVSDLAGLYALDAAMGEGEMDPALDVTHVTADELAGMMVECKAVVAY